MVCRVQAVQVHGTIGANSVRVQGMNDVVCKCMDGSGYEQCSVQSMRCKG